MKQTLLSAIVTIILVGAGVSASESGLADTEHKNGAFIPDYASVQIKEHEELRNAFMGMDFLENLTDILNKEIVIPRLVWVTLAECGMVNAFYHPAEGRITMCWELWENFLEAFKPFVPQYIPQDQLNKMVVGAWTFVFFHELGHALVDILELPVTGKEEDAVDQLSTVLLASGGNDMPDLALSAAYWFRFSKAHQRDPFAYWLTNVLSAAIGNSQTYADEHSLDEQRFYNVLCWLYGSHPERFVAFVDNGTLPKARAERCSWEYVRIKRSWGTLLGPHLSGSLKAELLPRSMTQTAGTMQSSAVGQLDTSQSRSDAPSGHLVGQVLRSTKKGKSVPVPDASVLVYPDAPELGECKLTTTTPFRTELTDKTGSFAFRDLAAGTYQVCATYDLEDVDRMHKGTVEIGRRVHIQPSKQAKAVLKK